MIRYPEFRERGWQIGSGPTESQCKLCTKRLKGYGRRWDRPNATAVAALDTLDRNGQWRQVWPNANVQSESTEPVGKRRANPWGLYDVHGNADEICLDYYLPDYYKRFAAIDRGRSEGPEQETGPSLDRQGDRRGAEGGKDSDRRRSEGREVPATPRVARRQLWLTELLCSSRVARLRTRSRRPTPVSESS